MHFTLGSRLRDLNGIDGWSSDRPNLVADIGAAIAAKGLPFLDQVGTLEGAAKAAEAMRSPNSHVQEAAACCWALAGNIERAACILDPIPSRMDTNIEWQAEQANRIEGLKNLFRSNPEAAKKRLLAGEAETAQNIGMGSFWSRGESPILPNAR